MKGVNIMYGYWGKVAGIIIAALGAIMLITQKLTDFIIISKLSSAQHFNILLWITVLGLFTIAFSKEKHEDERVQQIRTRAFAFAFMMVTASTLAFAFAVNLMPTVDEELAQGVTLTPAEIIELSRIMMFYPAVAVVIYLIMFHIGLYFDQTWDYENESWTFGALLRNKRYRIAFVIVGIIIIELLFRVFK